MGQRSSGFKLTKVARAQTMIRPTTLASPQQETFMPIVVAFLLAGLGIALMGGEVRAQGKVVAPTPEQLTAAKDGFAKIGGKYSYVVSPRTLVGSHTFTMPHLLKDDKMKLLPEVPFTFALNLSQTALTPEGLKEIKKFQHLQAVYFRTNLVTGEGIDQFAGLPSFEELDLSNGTAKGKGFGVITPAELQGIGKLQSLKTLDLSYCRLTPECMAPLKELPRLTTLHLSAAPARFFPGNPAGVVRGVKDLKSLTTLSVDHANSDTFRELQEAKQLRTLRINITGPVNKIGLNELGKLDQLTGIEMSIYPGTDEDLEALRGVKNLTSLKFRGGETKITDAGLKHMTEHKSLKTFYLTCNKVTDAGVKHICQVKSLEVLRLTCNLTEASLASLKDLPELTTLDFRIDKLSERGMKDLSSMRKLRYLAARIPDACTPQFKDVPSLKALVCIFGLTDKGLHELQGVRSLTYVNVFFCVGNTVFNVTDKGLDAFQAARPDCIISRERPVELGFERDDEQ